jgi:signal transduction histidine kinase
MEAYARLARLPPPQKEHVDIGELIRRVVSLEPRLAVQILPGPEARITADGAQIEQLLINLVHNAVDASLETHGGSVSIGWREASDCIEVFVTDEGPGIMNPTNLFVPFFTTKPGGSGIGLALSRQIAEAHGGSLGLTNRHAGTGAEATLRLPR